MPINLSAIGNGAPAPAAPAPPTPAPVVAPGAILDLSKNTVLDITKRTPSLRRLQLAAGWDVSRAGAAIDIDLSVFLLNSAGKVVNVGTDVVFFNQKTTSGVSLRGDNLTGEGEGDDEIVDVDLSAVAPGVEEVVFAVNIHDAEAKRQTFGMVVNSYVRLLNTDKNDEEMCRFILKDDYSSSTAVVFAKLKRNGSEWEFITIGEGKQADLNGLLALYM